MKDKCQHYSGVDKGFYCWKCLEQQRNQIISEEIKTINKFLERLKGYCCGYHKELKKQMLNRIKKLEAKV